MSSAPEVFSQVDSRLGDIYPSAIEDVLPPVYVLTAGQVQHQGLVQGGKGQEVETVQALYGGEAGLLDALLPLDDL